MHDLTQPGKRDYKTKIIRFLTDIEPAPLTSDEETILSRWELADRLLRAKEPHAYIVDQLVKTFGVSTSTASNDVYAAMEVFGRSRRLNKNYLLAHHLDRIDWMIEKIKTKWSQVGKDGQPDYYPDPKEIQAVARLTESYTYAVNSVPQQSERANLPPPVMVFTGLKGTTLANGMSVEDAIHYADDIIKGNLPENGAAE